MQRRHTAGFTLLEAIVAIAIISMALIPLISFIAQAAGQLQHAGDVNEQSLTAQSAAALLESMNPMAEPTGSIPLDRNITVTWDSKVLVEPNSSVLVGAGLGPFRIGFYNVHVSVDRRDTGRWFTFELRKVGYQKLQITNPFAPVDSQSTPMTNPR